MAIIITRWHSDQGLAVFLCVSLHLPVFPNFYSCIFLLDQELVVLLVFLDVGRRPSKKSKEPSFQIGLGEIWQECSSRKFASIDGVGYSI